MEKINAFNKPPYMKTWLTTSVPSVPDSGALSWISATSPEVKGKTRPSKMLYNSQMLCTLTSISTTQRKPRRDKTKPSRRQFCNTNHNITIDNNQCIVRRHQDFWVHQHLLGALYTKAEGRDYQNLESLIGENFRDRHPTSLTLELEGLKDQRGWNGWPWHFKLSHPLLSVACCIVRATWVGW